MATMLAFGARHGIDPQIATFPMSRVNDAIEKLKAGRVRYPIIFQNDI
jgi:uncharacterized zinc-type alcohol dehydrogenase-like protein